MGRTRGGRGGTATGDRARARRSPGVGEGAARALQDPARAGADRAAAAQRDGEGRETGSEGAVRPGGVGSVGGAGRVGGVRSACPRSAQSPYSAQSPQWVIAYKMTFTPSA